MTCKLKQFPPSHFLSQLVSNASKCFVCEQETQSSCIIHMYKVTVFILLGNYCSALHKRGVKNQKKQKEFILRMSQTAH